MASSAYWDCSAIYLAAQCMAGCMHGSIMLIAGKGSDCLQTTSTPAMRLMQLLQTWQAWTRVSLKDSKAYNDCYILRITYCANALPVAPVVQQLCWQSGCQLADQADCPCR